MTNNETSYREKGRAVFLAALMVVSVVAMSAAFAGGVAASNHADVNEDKDDLPGQVWKGQEVSIGGFAADETQQLREGVEGDSERVQWVQADSSGWITIDTTELDTGPHFIGNSTSAESDVFWVQEQDLDASFDPTSTTDTSTLTVDSEERADTYNVTIVEADGQLDAEAINETFDDASINDDGVVELEVTDGTDTFEGNFEDVELNEYTFDLDVTDSTAAATATVTVEEEEEIDESVNFGEVPNQQRGDVLEFDLEFEHAEEYDDVHFQIDEDNYHANVTLDVGALEGDETVTIEWNTHDAGKSGAFSVVHDDLTDGDLNVDDETTIADGYRLAASGYTFSLYADDDYDNRVDSASATIQPRETGDADVSIAPQGSFDDEELEDLLDASTDSSTLAEGDIAIVEVDVSGIFGYAIGEDGNFTDESGVAFDVTSTEAPAYSPAESFNETDEIVTLVPDADNNKLYFVIETEVGDEELEGDDVSEWDVDFTIDGDTNDYVANGEEESASTSYTLTERMTELGLVEEPYQIPFDSQEIRGVSTLAPGSNVDVTVDNPGVFLEDSTVEVFENEDGDRVWTYTVNNNIEDGDDLLITVNDGEEIAAVGAETPEWETQPEVAELEEQLAELRGILGVDTNEELADEVKALQENSEDLHDLLESQGVDNVTELENKIADLEDSEQTLTELLESQGVDNVTELENKIADLEDSEQTLTELLAQHDVDSVEELNQKIDDLSEDELAEVLDQYENVNTAEDLHNYIEGLENDSNELDTLLTDYEKESVEDLKQYISDLENDSAALDDLFEKTETETVDELKNHIDDLNTEIADLNEKIDELESENGDDANGDDNGDDDESDDGTPGFGVAVALVALLGAAMLALRRQN